MNKRQALIYNKFIRVNVPSVDQYLTLTNEMKALADFGYLASDAFADLGKTTPITDDTRVLLLEQFGNNPTTPDDLVWQTPDFVDTVWYYDGVGSKPRYRQKTINDRFLEIKNGYGADYSTGASDIGLGDTSVDVIYVTRPWFGSYFESMFSVGSLEIKEKEAGLEFNDKFGFSQNTTVIPVRGENNIIRITKEPFSTTGNFAIYLNDLVTPAWTGTSTNNTNINRVNIGTDSNPAAQHFRAMFVKVGSFFTTEEVATIKANSTTLWPLSTKPDFPYLDDAFVFNAFLDYNGGTTTYDFGNGTFSGGSGIGGTHTYQWYYYNNTMGLPATALRNHQAIVGATNKELNLSLYPETSSNVRDGTNQLFRVTTPVDSLGVEGLPIVSAIITDA